MDALATVLLRRAGAVALPAPGPHTGARPHLDDAARVTALEATLAARGWLLSPALRDRLAALEPVTRGRWSDFLGAAADAAVGTDRDHTPLFRRFPRTPASIASRYAERIIVHLLQDATGPCILCGETGALQPLDPCGHPVCTRCFDPAEYSACPVCGRQPSGGSAYLPLTPPARRSATPPGTPLRLRRITLTDEPDTLAARLRDDLVARPAALGTADLDDLRVLVAATAPDRLDWLPDTVPARETLASVLAWALTESVTRPGLVDAVAARWDTVTDVARTLWAYSGGDPGLILPRRAEQDGPGESWRPWAEPRIEVAPPRVRALSRPLRRAVLTFIDTRDLVTAAEDLTRHPVVWKRLAERLHPFTVVTAHPSAAVAFAALRGTRAPGAGALGRLMIDAGERRPDRLVLTRHGDGRVSLRVRSFAALVEAALAAGDVSGATALLAQRPGDLWRRMDHLLRLAGDDDRALRDILDAAASTAPRVAPGVLAGAAAALHDRDRTVRADTAAITAAREAATARRAALAAWRESVRTRSPATTLTRQAPEIPYRGPAPGRPRRTFFPKGDVVRTWTEPELRVPIPVGAIFTVRSLVDIELTGRASPLPRFDLAVLDASLARVPAPARERAGAEQLAGWPRGSVRTVRNAEVLRLFLHWVDLPGRDGRVDLDLSCAFYTETWQAAGHCDYTNLHFLGRAAAHSGDLTSAPAPKGATEFLDLDRAKLQAAGVHWAVPVVMSYNDVPFETLPEAFAGLALPAKHDGGLDPARVLQRFGLRGNAKSTVPMVLHVPSGELMWLDAALTTHGYGHSVSAYGPRLGRIAADLWEHYATGTRTTLLDLASWHAVARADRVLVRHSDTTVTEVLPGPDAAARVALIRAAAAGTGSGVPLEIAPGDRVFAAAAEASGLPWYGVDEGNPVGAGSVAVVAEHGGGDSRWTVVSAADLAAGLTVPRV